MKKVVVAIVSTLMLFMTSLIPAFATMPEDSHIWQKINCVMSDVLHNYSFVEKSGQVEDLDNKTLSEIYNNDVQSMEKTHKGGPRELVHLLLYKLHEKGIMATLIMFPKSNFLSAVLIFLNGQSYVLDPCIIKVYEEKAQVIGVLNIKPNEITLDKHLEMLGCKRFFIIKDYIGNINKSFSELKSNVDYYEFNEEIMKHLKEKKESGI